MEKGTVGQRVRVVAGQAKGAHGVIAAVDPRDGMCFVRFEELVRMRGLRAYNLWTTPERLAVEEED